MLFDYYEIISAAEEDIFIWYNFKKRYFISEQMPPGMPSMAQARTIQGIPSGASDQEKVYYFYSYYLMSCSHA